MQLLEKIKNRTATVGVMGLGYVGLPLIDAFHNAGFPTLGFDIDKSKVEQLKSGNSYIAHIPDETIAGWVSTGRFDATVDVSRLSDADVDFDLRPNSTDFQPRPGFAIRGVNGQRNIRIFATRPVSCPGKHDLSRNDQRCRSTDPAKIGLKGWN